MLSSSVHGEQRQVRGYGWDAPALDCPFVWLHTDFLSCGCGASLGLRYRTCCLAPLSPSSPQVRGRPGVSLMGPCPTDFFR